jgi:hypothetical protein
MEFSVSYDVESALEGLVVYTESDHAFGFRVASPMVLQDRVGDAGVTSLSIDTLQIEVAVATRVVLFVWGLRPRVRWQDGVIEPPSARPGLLRVADSVTLKAGVSVRLSSGAAWSTTYDAWTGWVRVEDAGNPDKARDRVLVASSTVVGLFEDKITSIWLQPVFE